MQCWFIAIIPKLCFYWIDEKGDKFRVFLGLERPWFSRCLEFHFLKSIKWFFQSNCEPFSCRRLAFGSTFIEGSIFYTFFVFFSCFIEIHIPNLYIYNPRNDVSRKKVKIRKRRVNCGSKSGGKNVRKYLAQLFLTISWSDWVRTRFACIGTHF